MTATRSCLHACRCLFPGGLSVIAEVAKGLELKRLNRDDPIQAYGPLLRHSDAWCRVRGEPPLPPAGFVVPGKGTAAARTCRQRFAEIFCPRAAPRPVEDTVKIPPTLGPQRAILIAFGGRRRQGDIVWHLERMVAAHTWGGTAPVICVLDLVHGQQHDAARGAARAWINAVLAGMVVGIFVSPPCETWSIARFNEEGDLHVKPVRSQICLGASSTLGPGRWSKLPLARSCSW